MPRFCVNLSLLFTEVPFPERFARAAAAGFQGVECQFPYAWAPDILEQALRTQGLDLVLFNLPAGDWAAGERGLAGLPGREGEFRDGVARALVYARTLGCRRLNCLAGVPPAGADPCEVDAVLAANLRWAADALGREGVQLLLEPLNDRDLPGFRLVHLDETLALLKRLAHPNMALQYDVYHRQVMEGDAVGALADCLGRTGHIQIGDHPGRREPGTGEIDFHRLFRLLDRAGYPGWVGCEYFPAGDTRAGLVWRDTYARTDAPPVESGS